DEAVLGSDAVARARSAVADGTMDVEAVFPTAEEGGVQLIRNLVNPFSVNFAPIEIVFRLQKFGVEARCAGTAEVIPAAVGHRSRDGWAHGPAVREKGALRLSAVTRLDLHVEVILQRRLGAPAAPAEDRDQRHESSHKAGGDDSPTLHVTPPRKRHLSRPRC